jgi:hypothetical protein
MGTLLQDLRYGLRMLAKNPGFTAVAVLTLALGIGATAAIFSVVYGVLLRTLPYPKPDQIVDLREMKSTGGRMNFADPNFEDIRSQNQSMQGVAEYRAAIESVSGAAEPTRMMVATVSQDFFAVMGVQPVLGRGFAAEEQRMGVAPVALISFGYWKQNLNGATDLSTIKRRLMVKRARSSECFRPVSASPMTVIFGFRAAVMNGCPAAPRTIGKS